MKEIDFKNLTVEQEVKLNELLDTLSKSALSSIDGVSGSSDDVSIYSGSDELSLTQLKLEVEQMTPTGIDHLRMYFQTIEKIMRIKSQPRRRFWLGEL